MRGLVLYGICITLVAVGIFLYASSFFSEWDGRAVSVRPPVSEEPSVYRVLIVHDSGGRLEMTWTADAVDGLKLPVDATGIPPRDIADRPRTRKERYTLAYEVESAGGGYRQFPTTRPQGLATSVLFWVGAVLLRNMYVGGGPFQFMPRDRQKLELQRRSGAVEPQKGRSTKTAPPPAKGKKGKRKR